MKHLEDKYRENAKLNTDRLRDLELQMKQLTDYIKKGDFATSSSNFGAAVSNSNDDKFPALQPNNMTSIVVKKEQDNPSSDGFFAFV